MGADGLSYSFDLDKQQPGIDATISKLGQSEKAIDANDSKLKDLQQQLNKLRVPAELDRLQKAVTEFGKPKPVTTRDEIGQLQTKLGDLKAPAELARLKKEVEDFSKPKAVTSKDQISALQQKLSDLRTPGEIKRLQQEIANFGKPAAQHFQGIGHSIEEAKGKLTGFLEFSGALAAFEIMKGLTERVIDFGKETVNATLKAERLDGSLKLRFGVEGGEELDKWAGKFAHLTQLSKEQIKIVGGQLLGAGVDNEDLNRYTGAALDFAAKSQEQDKYGAAMQATQALSQAARFGKVSARTITNLGLSNDALRTLPEYSKLNDKQLREKMRGDSTITEEQLLRVMRGKGKLGESAYEGGKDMGSRLKNIGGMWDEYLSKLTASPAYESLKGKLGEIFEILNPESPKGQQIFATLDHAFTELVEQVGKIDFVAVADSITNDVIPAVKTFIGLIGPTLDAINTTITGLSAAGHAASKVWNFNFGLGKERVEDAQLQQKAEILRTPNTKLDLGKSVRAAFAGPGPEANTAAGEPTSDTSYDSTGGVSGGDVNTTYSSPRFASRTENNRPVTVTGDVHVHVQGGADPNATGQSVGTAAAASFKEQMIKGFRQSSTEMGSG